MLIFLLAGETYDFMLCALIKMVTTKRQYEEKKKINIQKFKFFFFYFKLVEQFLIISGFGGGKHKI